MKLSMYQVDAFANAVFAGNPAAVCLLEEWLSDSLMQKIAEENNLSETAFLVPQNDGADYHIRWFTPTSEVELCGHATMAAAHVVFHHSDFDQPVLTLNSASGPLTVTRKADLLTLDFPVWDYKPISKKQPMEQALGVSVLELYEAPDWMAVIDSQQMLESLTPDMVTLAQTPSRGVIVTAPADSPDIDFVSRCFFPGLGIDEDPATGSAHCVLTPYWAKRLGKNSLNAKQLSKRGGDLQCELKDGRVHISGQTQLYMQATIFV